MLRETAQYQGAGEHFLSFEGDGEGYVAWVRGAAGQQHQITLKMLVPLTVMGQETRLRLLAPRADGFGTEAQGALRQGGGQGF